MLVLFIAAYIGVDPALYHGGMLELAPSRERDRVALTLKRLATTLRRWLVTQLIAMVVIGAVTTVFLFVIHVKAALPLGILAGIAKFIPIVGSIFAAIPAIAMAFIDSPHKALVVGLGYIVIQFLEGAVLVPIVMRNSVGLSPFLVIVSLLVGAAAGGLPGALLAVPVAAALEVVVRRLQAREVPVAVDPAAIDAESDGDDGGVEKERDEKGPREKDALSPAS